MAAKKKKAVGKTLKDVPIQIRLSAEQKRAFDDAATQDGRTLSAWLRWLGDREIDRKRKGEG
jgi:hypothetical protein